MTSRSDLKNSVRPLVEAAFHDLSHIYSKFPGLVFNDDLILYGKNGICDSLSLVHLISIIEQKLFKHFSRKIVIANERAFSEKNSPFSTVGRMCAFIEEQASNSAQP
jgi:hypothetical protein